MAQKSKTSQAEPTLTNIQGRLYANLDWVLNRAHADGLKRQQVELLQIPCEDNNFVCIMKATIETSTGVFDAHGDATPKNTGKKIVPHLIRMAESRAIGRAMRFAVNAPTLVEELSEEDKRQNASSPSFETKRKP